MDPARDLAPSVSSQLDELAQRLHAKLIAEAADAPGGTPDDRIAGLVARAARLLDAAAR